MVGWLGRDLLEPMGPMQLQHTLCATCSEAGASSIRRLAYLRTAGSSARCKSMWVDVEVG